jgi:hypothetical protein
MFLNKKFQDAASSYAVKINILEVDGTYRITAAE